MGIPSVIKIDITKKFILILFEQLYILLFGYISLHSAILVPKNSCIMLVSILLFQHYSCQIRNLLFLILCQHNRLRPTVNVSQRVREGGNAHANRHKYSAVQGAPVEQGKTLVRIR